MPYADALKSNLAKSGFRTGPWLPGRREAAVTAESPEYARRDEQAGQARINEQPYDEDRGLTFEAIHRKYNDKIYNQILRIIGNPDDAEDLTVETFMNAHRAWDRFRGEAKVSTWLYQIAHNCCKNQFKQKDRRREREPVSLDDMISTDGGDITREVADWRNAPERLLLDQEFAEQIRKAVEALPEEYRTVLILAQREDMSYEQIAQVTGLSVPAVKTRLHRARNKMRLRLEPYYRNWQKPDH